jgi:hypothetical protein
MSIQVVYTSTSSSQSVGPFSSTKVRVNNGANPVFYAVGASPTAYAGNCEIIAPNQTRYINMQGLNNSIAFLGNVGASTVSVQQIGAVYASAVAQNSTTYLNP